MKKRIVISFTCVFFYFAACAQQQKGRRTNLRLDAMTHYGFIIPHHKTMQHLAQSHFLCYEVNLSEQTHGRQLWEQLFKYPLKGIGLFYTPLGNTRTLGHAVALYPYLNFCLTKGKKINLYFRVAMGLGYLTKRFDAETNYKNIAIGTHLNAFIQLKYEVRWKVTDRFGLSAGISLSHFSNGAIKVPNLGINVPAVNLGCSYKLFKDTPGLIHNVVPVADKKWQYSVLGRFGVNELYGAGGRKYPYYCLTGYFMKPLSMKRQIGAGIDIYYSESVVEMMRRREIPIKSKLEAIRPGLSFVYMMNFSRFSFIAQLGSYIYNKEKSDGYIFDRVALQYSVKDHYLFQIGLKTHLARAEVLEMCIGYRF